MLGQVETCGATRLDAKLRPLITYQHTLTIFTEGLLRLAYSASAFPLALGSPFNPVSLLRFHPPQLSLREAPRPTHSSSTV